MDTTEIVVHEVQRNGVLKVLNLLAKPVRQSREAAHGHPTAAEVDGSGVRAGTSDYGGDALEGTLRPIHPVVLDFFDQPTDFVNAFLKMLKDIAKR